MLPYKRKQQYIKKSFESAPAGVGTNYSADTEFEGFTPPAADANDYWQRILVTGNAKDEIGTGVTGADGTMMYAGEDIDGAAPTPKVLTLIPVNVSAYTSLDVQIAVGSGTLLKYDVGDYIEIYVKKDAGAEELIGAYYGYDFPNSDGTNGRMYEDVNLSGGVSDDGQLNQLSKAMITGTFSVTGTPTMLQVIVKMTTNSGGEVLMVDNIRVRGVAAGPPATSINMAANSLTGFSYMVGTGPSTEQSSTLQWQLIPAGVTNFISSPSVITDFEFRMLPNVATYQPYVNLSTALQVLTAQAAFKTSPLVYTLDVRLVSGLAVGTYLDTVVLIAPDGLGGTVTDTVFLEGEVTPPLPDIILNEFQADPDATNGDANGDGVVSTTNDEFVEYYNNEASAVDMSGWKIYDGAGLKHTFPAASVVPAGGFVTVFGGGTPTGIPGVAMVASPSGLGLNNGGDDIILTNVAGDTIVSETYGGIGGDNQSVGRTPDTTGAFVKHSTIVATGRLFSPGEFNVSVATSCSIDAIALTPASTPGACVPATNTYSVLINVTYSNPPASGTLDVNGQSFAITTSPQTVTLTGLNATGTDVDVTAVFSADGTCTATELAVFTAPCIMFSTSPRLF